MTLPHRIPASTRVVYTGRDQWTKTYTPPHAEAPLVSDFSGRWRLATWTVCALVGVLFWAAVFGMLFA